MAVLGADPDAPVKENSWDEFPRPAFNPRTAGLVHMFGYHPRMQMSQRFNDVDKKILSGHFSLMLRRGNSQLVLKEMINRFWQSWGAEYDAPAMAYVSREMQEKLTADVAPSSNDAFMEWLINGMPDDGPLDDPSHIRQAVVLASTDLTHRYPDVVAEIIKLNRGFTTSRKLLIAADQLIRWNLGEDVPDFDVYETLDTLHNIELPSELRTSVKSPASIRPKRDRLAQAVAHVPIPRKKKYESRAD